MQNLLSLIIILNMGSMVGLQPVDVVIHAYPRQAIRHIAKTPNKTIKGFLWAWMKCVTLQTPLMCTHPRQPIRHIAKTIREPYEDKYTYI